MIEYTLSKEATGDYKEKGSSFHAFARSASDINELKSILLNIKEEYSDASHICYAYRGKKGSNIEEFINDSREPRGSAGLPILNALKRQNLFNVAIFVIRYFGGNKLGIPGLIHAYGTAADNSIENAELKIYIEKKRLRITFPYEFNGVMNSILKKTKAEVIYKDFGKKIDIRLDIGLESVDKFVESIKELSAGSTKIIITH